MHNLKNIINFDVDKQIQKLNNEIIIDKNNNHNLQKEIQKIQEETEFLKQQLRLGVQAIDFIQKCANHQRSIVKDKVQNVISDALKEIYGDQYSIQFDYSMKRNKTSVDIYLTKHTQLGNVIRKQDGFGGGVSDVISLPLKLLVLMALKDNSKILIADEPGKHMDQRIDKFGYFLRAVSQKLGVQLIILTHHESLAQFADSVYQISMKNEVTTLVQKIK